MIIRAAAFSFTLLVFSLKSLRICARAIWNWVLHIAGWLLNNYLPKWSIQQVLDVYRATKRRGKYPPLPTDSNISCLTSTCVISGGSATFVSFHLRFNFRHRFHSRFYSSFYLRLSLNSALSCGYVRCSKFHFLVMSAKILYPWRQNQNGEQNFIFVVFKIKMNWQSSALHFDFNVRDNEVLLSFEFKSIKKLAELPWIPHYCEILPMQYCSSWWNASFRI